ncbi:iron ABC transporter permease [Roseomonas aerophila]|uniref:Iron ABC transporter permease n=1 Tax=Teichococcus aerophilus TaxID=1224513 RepID=A0ABR7RV78_9PROT|nr:iron ABC transporter permease [Pseudoroseomonas aerophila]MBC9209872.1 iron ABC transporter permease [Pseudoroseomonas aerophila]
MSDGTLAQRAPAAATPSLATGYAGFVRKRIIMLSLLAVALVLALLADIATGPAQLSLGTVVSGIFDPASLPRPIQVILWNVRLPYAIMAVLVGASLGLAGAEMQTVLNNPLASPFTLGVSAAATLGASLVIVMGLAPFGVPQHIAVPVGAFAFAAGASVLVQGLARLRGTGVDSVVLFGIALVFALNAAVALLQFVADAETLQQIVFWGMGSLARSSWPKIAVVAVVLAVCLPFSMLQVWKMTALRAGEAQAESLGIDTNRLRLVVMLRASLLAATAVAFVGTIGFVGLVGPHMARLLLGEDHRFFLPGAALAGAVVLSLASIASKMLVPGLIIPVGIVTSLVGVPLFLALLFGRGRG